MSMCYFFFFLRPTLRLTPPERALTEVTALCAFTFMHFQTITSSTM